MFRFFVISNECLAVISKRLFTKSNLPRQLLLQNAEKNGLSYFQAGMLSIECSLIMHVTDRENVIFKGVM